MDSRPSCKDASGFLVHVPEKASCQKGVPALVLNVQKSEELDDGFHSVGKDSRGHQEAQEIKSAGEENKIDGGCVGESRGSGEKEETEEEETLEEERERKMKGEEETGEGAVRATMEEPGEESNGPLEPQRCSPPQHCHMI